MLDCIAGSYIFDSWKESAVKGEHSMTLRGFRVPWQLWGP